MPPAAWARSKACTTSASSTAPTSSPASRPGRRMPRSQHPRIELMASESFDLRPVEAIGVATHGQPGQRQFFLQVVGAGKSVTLACEKFHIQGLVTRIEQLLESKSGSGEAASVKKPA